MRLSLFVCLLVGGCGASDPCDGIAGTCVTARVEGQPSTLDQLRVVVDGQPMSMLSPSTPGSAFNLPVRLALAFTNAPGEFAGITVDGLVGGMQVASSGKQTVPVPAGVHSSFTFTLSPSTGSDGGVADGSIDGMLASDGGVDLAPPPNVVSFEPSTFTFPDTPRGTQQAKLANIVFTNNTGKTVNATSINTTGDMNSFKFQPATTCPMTMNSVSLPAGMQCTMVLSFTPDASGALEQDTTVMFDDGETLTLTLKGNGLRAWTVESPTPNTTQFTAVWASGPSDWWAIGSSANNSCTIWRSTGNGQWQQSCFGAAENFWSVGGSGQNDVWIGGSNGDFWHYNGSSLAQQTTGMTGRLIRGIVMFSGADGVAVDDQGTVYCLGNGSPAVSICSFASNNVSQIPSDSMRSPFTGTSITGVNDWVYVGGKAGSLYNHQPGVNSWVGYLASALTGNGGLMDVNGVLYLPNGSPPNVLGDLFAVGDFGGGNNGAIFHANNSVSRLETPGGSQGPLFAVGGRIDPSTNKPDVYIVGGIGNQVLHTTGNGSYDQPQIGGLQGIGYRGVWVTIDGQVVVVGDAGQIVHYY